MILTICDTKIEMGQRAAMEGADLIRKALAEQGEANIIVATGASQFEVLEALTKEDLDWSRVTGFHLDEYVGLPISHGASFRGYLWQRFLRQLPLPLRAFYFLEAETKPEAECRRVGDILLQHPIHVAFIGIGENGHIAFNDPPADFETEDPYLVVELDDACRRQQLGEGWFSSLTEVPTRAVSMSVRQILKSATIICTVPDKRKAEAVRGAMEAGISSAVPASILRSHPDWRLFLDQPAASLLR